MDEQPILPGTKLRKTRSDKGMTRHRVIVREVAPAAELPPVLVVVDGEEIRCNTCSFEGGFLKLSYWPEQRGRIGTRYIATGSIKDLRIERPLEMNSPNVVGAIEGATAHPPEAMGPVSYVNPVLQVKRDPKAFQGQTIRDPVGLRPMSKIIDENGNESVVEAGIT